MIGWDDLPGFVAIIRSMDDVFLKWVYERDHKQEESRKKHGRK